MYNWAKCRLKRNICLESEGKTLRGLCIPVFKCLCRGQVVKRVVDFHGIEMLCVVGQPLVLGQSIRIEASGPVWIIPPGRTNANFTVFLYDGHLLSPTISKLTDWQRDPNHWFSPEIIGIRAKTTLRSSIALPMCRECCSGRRREGSREYDLDRPTPSLWAVSSLPSDPFLQDTCRRHTTR